MITTDSTSLKEVKDFLRKNWKKGCVCPACTRKVKVTRRKIYSAMSVTLIRIYKETGKDWIHVKDFLRSKRFYNTHEWTLFKYWNILEQKKNNSTKKRTSGIWRITDKGEQFVLNKIRVPKHAFFFNGKNYGFAAEDTNIVETLDVEFDYQELISLTIL